MDLPNIPFQAIDWQTVETENYTEGKGSSLWKTAKFGEIRVRLAEHLPGFSGTDWCSKGHIVFVIKGSLTMELKDGRSAEIRAGQSWIVGDDNEAHFGRSEKGCTLFIVD